LRHTGTAQKTVRPGSVFFLFLTFLIWGSFTSAFADLIYSGPRNILLQGVPGTVQSLVLDLGGTPGDSDDLQLSIAEIGLGGGTADSASGHWATLASSAGIFPVVSRYSNGDPYPSNPVFGSGSLILWGFGFGPADGNFFAATRFGNGPEYSGWIHLIIQESATSNASITVVDWAFSNVVGQTIQMGQVSQVPEPSSFALLGGALPVCLLLFWIARKSPEE